MKNHLHHLALAIAEIDKEKIQAILTHVSKEEIKAFSLYSSQDLSEDEIESIKFYALNAGVRFYYLPFGNARKNLLDKFKKLLLGKTEKEIKGMTDAELAKELAHDKEFPEPDLIIKVGETKESLENTFIMEASYAEIYFAKKNPKDFVLNDVEHAIQDFETRKRNFGA